MLVSKQPEWFGLYSTPKISFIFCSIIFCFLFYYFISKVQFSKQVLSLWEKIASKSMITFLIVSTISTIPFIGKGVSVGEDIGGQVKSSIQWINGQTVAPNFISEPKRIDLAVNQSNWSLRPPGAAILPAIGMLLGLSLGHSIQISLLLCSILGGFGWLHVFKEFKIDKYIIFLFSIMLGFDAGSSISSFATANIILFAIVPWFVLLVDKFDWLSNRTTVLFKNYAVLAIFLLLLGCFAWIKLSGIIVAGTIGACLFFILLNQTKPGDKIKFIMIFLVLGISFCFPFLLLEKTNHFFSGITADQLYGENDSDIQAPLFGKHWGDSTKAFWLLWSIASAPGYSMPIKEIAHVVRNLGMQFEDFMHWLNLHKINAHVFVCGLIGLVFTFCIVVGLKNCWHALISKHKIILCSFLILPFVGLAILSFRYEWNYLLYHAHTFEFWIILSIPTLVTNSIIKRTSFVLIVLLGVILAIPTSRTLGNLYQNIFQENREFISSTEKKRGLSSCRFSEAIDYIEDDSKDDIDIIFFLPSGNMGDLVMRSKLRTMATHFSGDNFPKHSPYSTSKELYIYLAYDEKLAEIPKFSEATTNKFQNSVLEQEILKGGIIVKKIRLFPTPSTS